MFVRSDVSKPDDVADLHERIFSEYGRLDIAFNNAGIEGTPKVSVVDDSEENWDQVIDINLKGVWLCLRKQLSQMLQQEDGGAIVNMSSVAGLRGGRIGAPY